MDMQGEWQRQLVIQALSAPGIHCGDLWFAYLGLGGTSNRQGIEAHVEGSLSLPPLETDLLAEAARELLQALRPLPKPKPHSPE